MKKNIKVILIVSIIIILVLFVVAIATVSTVDFIQKKSRADYIAKNGITTTTEEKEYIPYTTTTIEMPLLPEGLELVFTDKDNYTNMGMSGEKVTKYQVIIDRNTREILEKNLIEEKIISTPNNETLIKGTAKITNNQEFHDSELYKFAIASKNALNNNDWEFIYNNLSPTNIIRDLMDFENFKNINELFTKYVKNTSIENIDEFDYNKVFNDSSNVKWNFEQHFQPKIIEQDSNKYVSLTFAKATDTDPFSNSLDVIIDINTNKLSFNTGNNYITKYYIGPKEKVPSIDAKNPNADYQLGLYQQINGNSLLITEFILKDDKITNIPFVTIESAYVYNDNSTNDIGDILKYSKDVPNLNHIKIYFLSWHEEEIFNFNILDFQQLFTYQDKIKPI